LCHKKEIYFSILPKKIDFLEQYGKLLYHTNMCDQDGNLLKKLIDLFLTELS